jgi:hypothetical protein
MTPFDHISALAVAERYNVVFEHTLMQLGARHSTGYMYTGIATATYYCQYFFLFSLLLFALITRSWV